MLLKSEKVPWKVKKSRAKWKSNREYNGQKCRLTDEKEMKEIMAMHARDADDPRYCINAHVKQCDAKTKILKIIKLYIVYSIMTI